MRLTIRHLVSKRANAHAVAGHIVHPAASAWTRQVCDPGVNSVFSLLRREFYGFTLTTAPTNGTETGATENAGVENAIRAKLQGWKMQE